MENRFSIQIICGFLLAVAFMPFVCGGDTSSFEVDILGPAAPTISISVQDTVFFGSLSKGEETDNVKIVVNNTGNVALIVTPQLVNKSEIIFNNTYFQRRTTEPYYKIGNFSFNISAPTTTGGVKSDYIYAKLDLRNYAKNITTDIPGYKTNVRFFAVAQ